MERTNIPSGLAFDGPADVRIIPQFELLDGQTLISLLSNIVLFSTSAVFGSIHLVAVAPVNFVCDGGSIPKFFWPLIGHPFDTRWIRSAIVHDWLCTTKQYTSDKTHKLFYECMLIEGNSRIRSTLMYLAVKWFGPNW